MFSCSLIYWKLIFGKANKAFLFKVVYKSKLVRINSISKFLNKPIQFHKADSSDQNYMNHGDRTEFPYFHLFQDTFP